MDRINGARTVDIGGGRRGFQSQNRSAGRDGTEVTAPWLNDVQENLARVIEAAGLVLQAGDWTLLERAIARLSATRSAANIPLDGVVSSAPGAPAEGTQFRIAAAPTGIWAGRADQIARWQGGAWFYEVPRAGRVTTRWQAGRLVTERFDGEAWAEWLATDAAAGPVELATLAETMARLRSDVAVTPAGLKPVIDASAGRLINIQIFTSSGTYTPSPGMTFAIVEGCGGGGAGGGAGSPSSGQVSLGSPGGGASSGRARFTATEIGASRAVTIGAGGVGSANANGGAGGSTVLAGLLTLPGGQLGGVFNNAIPPAFNGNGSIAVFPTGANISSKNGATPGYSTAISASASGIFVGPSGDTPFGTGRANAANTQGVAGIGYGSGGSGVAMTPIGGTLAGGNGAPGILIILEFGS